MREKERSNQMMNATGTSPVPSYKEANGGRSSLMKQVSHNISEKAVRREEKIRQYGWYGRLSKRETSFSKASLACASIPST